MKKFLLVLFSIILISASVLASQNSFRGDGGNIEYLGGDSNLITKKIHMSFSETDNKDTGSLQVIGETLDGKRVVLNLKFEDGAGHGTYFKQGEKPKKVDFFMVGHTYSVYDRGVVIYGFGDIFFRIRGIKLEAIR